MSRCTLFILRIQYFHYKSEMSEVTVQITKATNIIYDQIPVTENVFPQPL